ncbi:hypothetical protein [Streptomyces sp. MJP52]|uniref:hypothetical protein n=1 Tax=Streptomyces sp. MJP52 TaxID=2940555 RepID=UPI0024772AA5|nr:hypothetical protein [Streptomyces sp. MJP52]MDH6227829.1 hypothetical protein [Streptomyces sp. MJP52]
MSRAPGGGGRGTGRAGGAGQPREQRQGVIVLAGEDQNDCAVLADLLRAHLPGLARTAKIVRINDPVRLWKKDGPRLNSSVETLVGKARARALRERLPLLGFVVHEDLDGYADARYEKARRRVCDELRRQCGEVRAALALAAWETEGWLLLFPDTFPLVHGRWRIPAQLRGRDTGNVKEPKEELRRALHTPGFRESDGPLVSRKALLEDLIGEPVGRNRSYQDFLEDLRAWERVPGGK